MLADRLNSFHSGSSQQRNKTLLLTPRGPAFGCAGDTQVIEDLFECLRERWGVLTGNSYDRFKTVYGELLNEVIKTNQLMGVEVDPVIETIAVEVTGGLIVSFGAVGVARKSINQSSITALPEDFPELLPYLQIDSTNLSEEKAIELGKQILSQMCFFRYRIGPPEYFGCNIIKIKPDGTFEEKIHSAKTNSARANKMVCLGLRVLVS
jgi:hypothetical protein